ncbi:isochorismatase family protein [Halegenticoccus tardaugens]|uniref:isochorismatase family protein n=1 Tax=Halegenticoccus tardaugens TaxID=2071624 RepID=UPI00100A7F4D|nr:isochorismatase family protein [Halegenticoccus tardaugens]
MTTDDSKEAVYERAGMTDNRIGFGERPAVVVVDVQNGMTDHENPLGADLPEMVEYANKVVQAAREANVPVVFTRTVTTHPDAADMGVFAEKIPALKTLRDGTEWTEIDGRMDVRGGDHVLDKRHASAFHGTELGSMLTAMGIDTLVVAGCSTSGCVRATVFDAVANGFRTAIPAEAVGDRSTAQHESNLFDMGAKNADVVSTEEVLAYLDSR